MKIAISINENNEINNMLDASSHFAIVDLDSQSLETIRIDYLKFEDEDSFSIISELKQKNIELILCGNISCYLKKYLNVLRIASYCFLKGDFLCVLECLKEKSGTFNEEFIIKNEKCKHLQNKEENYVFRQKFFTKRKRRQRKNGQ